MDTFWSLYEGFNNFLKDWGIWNFILIVFGFYVLQRLTREPYKRIKEYEDGKREIENSFYENLSSTEELNENEKLILKYKLKKHKEEFVLISIGSIWVLLILIAGFLSIIMFILVFYFGSN